MKRKDRDLCSPREAAARLGISIDEVEMLIATGELPGLTFIGDPRWFTYVDSVERMAARSGAGNRRARTRFWRSLLALPPRG